MKKVFLFILLSAIGFGTLAQSGIIRGTVFEKETGEPLFGVAVKVQNTTTGAVTDFDGKFQINVEPGTYTLEASFVSFKKVTITDLKVGSDKATVIDAVWMEEAVELLESVVVTAEVIRKSESALLTVKRKSPNVMDGISSENFRRIGDSNAGEAAKRVTGVSVEGGKYVYVRGLGDRYTKTTLNGLDLPGLDPDRNSIQIDVFPTNLIDNMMVIKSFTPELPADFTGGVVNIETKDFPEDKVLDVSFGIDFNPSMHFNGDYLDYEGSSTDIFGFDNGTRALPTNVDLSSVPTPLNSTEAEVSQFLNQFSPTLGATNQTSFMNYSLGVTFADQKQLANGNKLGFLFTGNYKNNSTLYDDAFFGEYQNNASDESVTEFQRAATTIGTLAENNVLLGGLAGVAYKTKASKYRMTLLKLQNGESRAGQFDLVDDELGVGKSGYFGRSDNLEYNERAITNLFINGEHHLKEDKWVIDWRGSSTWSSQEDPDIRKTAYTEINSGNSLRFNAGAAGNPSRLWRNLEENNIAGKVDVINNIQLFDRDAKLKFGISHTYKERDYEIVDFNVNFLNSQQPAWTGNATEVWTEENVFPNGSIFVVSGFSVPNPNQYSANVNNTGIYFSTEISPAERLKTIVGVRAENFVQRHTGRDQLQTRVLNNDKVLDALDFFPSANLIYELEEDKQNVRVSYSRTIARPSFKELSFAQILDPVSNRIFNGGLFPIDDWDGNLKETLIDNYDLRWEMFMERGQLFSVSAFYKSFADPIELVRIPQAVTNEEFQPRNVGDGRVMGVELEFRQALEFLGPKFSANGNLTIVESAIDMSPSELRNRRNNARTGEVIDETRNMAGQAPWIVNAGLSYNDFETGLDLGLFYNVKGETLTIVGGGIGPDVFSQPFHSLNFNLNKSFGAENEWGLNFSISNILGDRREQFYERAFSNAADAGLEASNEIFQRFSPGTSFGLGINYSF